MVPAGKKAKHLSLVNHTTKTIHHHHHNRLVAHRKISEYFDFLKKSVFLRIFAERKDSKHNDAAFYVYPNCSSKNPERHELSQKYSHLSQQLASFASEKVKQ